VSARRAVSLATALAAIAAVARHRAGLPGDAGYRAVLADSPPRVTSLLYLDLSQLLELGEQTGLTGSAGVRGLPADLARVRAVGLSSRTGEADSTTELLLQIP
jgi:hypothetical protein